MSQSKIRIFRAFIVTQYNFLFFYPIVMTMNVLTQAIWPPERPRLWVWLLGGLVFFGLYMVRCKVDNFITVILLHLAALGIQVGLSLNLSANDNPANLVLYLAFSIGFICHSLKLRYQGDNYEDNLFVFVFVVGGTALMILIQRYVSAYDWTNYYIYVLIVQITILFLVSYINEYLNFLTVNANSTGIMPEKEIFRSGMGFACIYTFASILILFATAQLAWLRMIMNFLLQIIRAILGFLFGRSGEGSTEPIQEVEHALVSDDKGIAPLPAGETSWIWDVLTVIILIVVTAIVLFVLYKVLIRLIQAINTAAKNKRKDSGAEELSEIVDVREKLDISRGKNHRRKPGELFSFLSAQDRIRRIYKKKVSQYKPNRLIGSEKQRKDDFTEERLKYYTAREMEDRMEVSFAEIYEKARYSDEECTSKDVKAMEAAFK